MEMRCSRGHGVSRAAGPQCQHVRDMPWSSCLTGGTSVSGALCFGMDQGVWCRWTVRVVSSSLWALAAGWWVVCSLRWSGWAPPASCQVVGGLVLGWAVPGVLVLEGLVSLVNILGSWHRAPCFRGACAEVCLEDAARSPLRVGEERGVVGSALRHDSHRCGGGLYYGDGGPHMARGVHLACRVPVDVSARGHEWPLLIDESMNIFFACVGIFFVCHLETLNVPVFGFGLVVVWFVVSVPAVSGGSNPVFTAWDRHSGGSAQQISG